MKKTLLLFSIILLISYANAQKLIAVQNGSTPSFYEDLSEAIENSVAGDTLYLPAKNFVVQDTIRKTVHLIGVGHHPDFSEGSGITILSKVNALTTQLHFESGSQGSSITGIRFEGTITAQGQRRPSITSDDTTFNLLFTRNYFKQGIRISASGSFLTENFFGYTSSFNSENGSSTLVSNSVFFGAENNFKNCFVNNSVFTNRPTFDSTFLCENSVFKNNVFPNNPFYNGFAAFSSTFYNNINLGNGSMQQGSYGVGNIDPNLEIEVIYNEVNLNTFLNPGVDFSFELPLDSPYLQSGQNGDEVGIYGGRFPWKEGVIPFNPHIVSKNISGSSDENGNLSIQIEVQAQEN